jgi:polysaccharide deacetylase family protein (PEP-CTERM system associated)
MSASPEETVAGMSAITNGLSFDIEDWFQVENLRSVIGRADWERLPRRVEANTRKILDMLRVGGIKATFFFLGWIAERYPQLVREVVSEGHEIASHGYGHELLYEMTPASFREDLRRSKELLEGITGSRILGYRGPSFSITPKSMWALDVLRDEGFLYDSSVFPISGHDRYGFANCDTQPFRWPNGLLEIPLAVSRLRNFALPIAGGGYFRLFPYACFRMLLKRLNANGHAFTFYLHPWELDPLQPRIRVPLRYRFRHYVNLNKTTARLTRLLSDFRFDRMAVAYDITADRHQPPLSAQRF